MQQQHQPQQYQQPQQQKYNPPPSQYQNQNLSQSGMNKARPILFHISKQSSTIIDNFYTSGALG